MLLVFFVYSGTRNFALTLTQLQTQISGPSDLTRVKVATVEGSTSADYLRSRYILFDSHADVDSALQSLVCRSV
jgi:hypothetical protein